MILIDGAELRKARLKSNLTTVEVSYILDKYYHSPLPTRRIMEIERNQQMTFNLRKLWPMTHLYKIDINKIIKIDHETYRKNHKAKQRTEMSLQKIEYSKNSMDTDENSFSMKVDKVIQKLKRIRKKFNIVETSKNKTKLEAIKKTMRKDF